VARINIHSHNRLNSPAIKAGLFCIITLLTACPSVQSPEQVTVSFWQALAKGQQDRAEKQATQSSQHLVNSQDIDQLSSIKTGAVILEGNIARVETTILRNKRSVTFDTALVKENESWKVDYLQTQMNITMLPLGDVFKSLQNLGNTFAKQVEKQIPAIQKEMENLGKDLKDQVDEFNRSLEKSAPPNKPKPPAGTI
jgi:hypothetical protein